MADSHVQNFLLVESYSGKDYNMYSNSNMYSDGRKPSMTHGLLVMMLLVMGSPTLPVTVTLSGWHQHSVLTNKHVAKF